MARRFGSIIAQLSGLALALGLVMAVSTPPVYAQSLDELRASGAVGERYDGFAVVRDAGAAGATSVVDEVNNQRRAIYEQRAAAQGVAPADVGRVYAGQIMQKAPSGTWFIDENGNWRQK